MVTSMSSVPSANRTSASDCTTRLNCTPHTMHAPKVDTTLNRTLTMLATAIPLWLSTH